MHELPEEIKVLQLQIRMNRKLTEALSKKGSDKSASISSAYSKIKGEIEATMEGRSEKFKRMMQQYFRSMEKLH